MRRAVVFQNPALQVKPCEYGWGVFTRDALPEGTLVERAPFLILDLGATQAPPLSDYVFRLSDEEGSALFDQRALVLGWGSLYNHADEPNVEYAMILEQQLFEFTTRRAVRAGEQLLVSYGAVWWNDRDLRPR